MPDPLSSQPGETDPDRGDATAARRRPPDRGENTPSHPSASETNTFPSGEPAPAAPASPTLLPRRLGRYELVGELGKGGFGTVYLGHDPLLGRQVAIKVPRRGRSALEGDNFLKEARRLAQLRHPGIVTVHDVGVQDDLCYIVTDLLDGESLAAAMRARRFAWDESALLAAGVADA